MKHPRIEGNGVFLRPLCIEDIRQAYIDWMNNPEVNQYLESRFTRQTKDTIVTYVRSFDNTETKALFGVFLKETEEHIGNISFSEINWKNQFGVIGICIGNKSHWGKGYASEALQLLVQYGFNALGLRRVEAGIFAGNTGSIRLFQKMGFQEEGRMRNRYLQSGIPVDGLIFGLLRPQ